MKKNVIPLLGIAFAVAIACTAVFYSLVSSQLGSGVKASGERRVVVAAREIPRGKLVSAGDVKTIPWTGSEPPEGAFSMVTQVEGLTAAGVVGPNEPLTSSRVMSSFSGGGLGVPSGMRAISMSVNDSSGVIAMLKPGHRVDVQAVYTRPGVPSEAELRTVLQNVEVLRVGSEGGARTPAVVTLLTTPVETEVAGLADSVARIRLVLRNPLDQEKAGRSGLGIGSVMRSAPAAASVSRPRSPAAPRVSLAVQAASCKDTSQTVAGKQ